MPEPPDPPAGGLTYDPELGPGYFVQTRADFLRWPHFAPLVKVLYQVLLTYCGAGETAWPGQDRLARDCGVSINTIRPALETLQAAGLVSITRRGLNRTNLYHVHKLPLVLAVPTKETQKLRIQTTNIGVSKSADFAAKVHSVESQTEETVVADENYIAAFRADLRSRCKRYHVLLEGQEGQLVRRYILAADRDAFNQRLNELLLVCHSLAEVRERLDAHGYEGRGY